ncbi:MAG: hypothetical protein KC503_46565 [Myxococcales bacterium]|nr:hypothetical protein [Myxococcales bacterium]
MRIVQALFVTLLALAALAASGCGGPAADGGNVCARAAQRVDQCLGAGVGAALAAQCSPMAAHQIIASSCDDLPARLDDGKFDLGVGQREREQIRLAVRQALRVALQQALAQVTEVVSNVLGDLVSQRQYYLILASEPSEASAQARAEKLRAAAGRAELFAPLVVERDGRFDVLHAVCPLERLADISQALTLLIVDHPKLIPLLGGSITRDDTPSDEGVATQMSIQLPLSVLPVTADYAAALGCQR